MLSLRASAKLNLGLRVLARRPDGYHELETLFERIDLADELTFEDDPRDIRLTCSSAELSCAEDNLVMKAVRLLQRECRTSRGARIHLLKRIPIAAGLGGGSSDAAATLLGLNALWELKLDLPRLVALAAQLGSDVPFFLSPEPFAIGRGRGERCEPLHSECRLAHVLVSPEVQLATTDIFAALDRHRATSPEINLTAPSTSITMIAHALRNGSDFAGLAEGLWNDLEPEAIRRCPVISLIQSHLREAGCVTARVSGSGPSVFGLCRDTTHAHEVAMRMRNLSPPSWRIALIQTDDPSQVVTASVR